MKINLYQKAILTVYAILFIYFSIIHVPFKTKYGNEVVYDTLFSNKSNLDVPRLFLIILVISILTVTLFLLLKNINSTLHQKTPLKKSFKIGTYLLVGIVTILAPIFIFYKSHVTPKTNIAVHSNSTFTDTTPALPSQYDLKKTETCTSEYALKNFQAYMKFYYPDWKIYGQPLVKEHSDCTYRIQFTTLDPHIRYEKEIMVVEISYSYDYIRYKFRAIRGTLY